MAKHTTDNLGNNSRRLLPSKLAETQAYRVNSYISHKCQINATSNLSRIWSQKYNNRTLFTLRVCFWEPQTLSSKCYCSGNKYLKINRRSSKFLTKRNSRPAKFCFKTKIILKTRWLYCAECPQYSIRLEAVLSVRLRKSRTMFSLN